MTKPFSPLSVSFSKLNKTYFRDALRVMFNNILSLKCLSHISFSVHLSMFRILFNISSLHTMPRVMSFILQLGDTALHICAWNSVHPAVIVQLCKSGAKPGLKNKVWHRAVSDRLINLLISTCFVKMKASVH